MSDVIRIDCDVAHGWVHTHGMAAKGLPELEIRGVDRFLVEAAATFLNEVCDSLLRTGRRVEPGDTMQTSPRTEFKFARRRPIPGEDEEHGNERLTIVPLQYMEYDPEDEDCVPTDPIPFDHLRRELPAMGLREQPDEASADNAFRITDDEGSLWAHRTWRGYAFFRVREDEHPYGILGSIRSHFATSLLYSECDQWEGEKAFYDLIERHYADEYL
jgi:hypothetical protein